MSRYGVSISLDLKLEDFLKSLDKAEVRTRRGALRALETVSVDLKNASLQEVPRMTNSLALSAFHHVEKTPEGGRATVGYGKEGSINAASGQPVNTYMVAVHEDLEAHHPVGKAKFLEEPVLEFEKKFFPAVATIIRTELEG